MSSVCMEKGGGVSSEDPGPLQTSRENTFKGLAYPAGKMQLIGDVFQFTVDVSRFSPEDVIITYYNNRIEVHADKVGEGGAATSNFSHQCKLPSNVDPLSVTMTLEDRGVLTVRALRVL